MRAPSLVVRAQALAAEHGFERSCTAEDGALLHVLAGRRGLLRVGEIGTGAGVGAAWIVSALPPATPFVTVESDARLAAAVAALFADAGAAKDDPDAVIGLVAPGGTIVVDDFTWDIAVPDPRRDAWLRHPEVDAVEIWTAPERRVIVATRR